MNATLPDDARVFRASTHMLGVIGIFSGLIFVITLFPAVEYGDWTVPLAWMTLVLAVLGFARTLRLEIGPHGITHRHLFRSRSLDFADIARAVIEVRPTKDARGCPTLCLESRAGRALRIHLRHFPLAAAAAMFTALDLRHVPIEVPDAQAHHWEEMVRGAQTSPAG